MNAEFPNAPISHPARFRCLRNAPCLILSALFLSSCSPNAKQSLFEGASSQEAVAKLSEKLKAPVRVFKIEIRPETLAIQVQDPAAPTQVNEYLPEMTGVIGWSCRSWRVPNRCGLTSSIQPGENLFDLGKVNFAAVAETVREAERRVALDGGGGSNHRDPAPGRNYFRHRVAISNGTFLSAVRANRPRPMPCARPHPAT
jgi:hypothetical protein